MRYFLMILMLVVSASAIAAPTKKVETPGEYYKEEQGWTIKGKVFKGDTKRHCFMGSANADGLGSSMIEYSAQRNVGKFLMRWNYWEFNKGAKATAYLQWKTNERQTDINHLMVEAYDINMIQIVIPDWFYEKFVKNDQLVIFLPGENEPVSLELEGSNVAMARFFDCLDGKNP